MPKLIVLLGLLAAGAGADELIPSHELNYRLAASRCDLFKRCRLQGAEVACKGADSRKQEWDKARAAGTDNPAMSRSGLDACMKATAEWDCARAKTTPLFQFWNDPANAGCAAYREYLKGRGRAVPSLKR